MLIWMCDVTNLNRIKNECIQASLRLTNMIGKMKKNRLRRSRNVMREDE